MEGLVHCFDSNRTFRSGHRNVADMKLSRHHNLLHRARHHHPRRRTSQCSSSRKPCTHTTHTDERTNHYYDSLPFLLSISGRSTFLLRPTTIRTCRPLIDMICIFTTLMVRAGIHRGKQNYYLALLLAMILQSFLFKAYLISDFSDSLLYCFVGFLRNV
jgi:hypothetical protein